MRTSFTFLLILIIKRVEQHHRFHPIPSYWNWHITPNFARLKLTDPPAEPLASSAVDLVGHGRASNRAMENPTCHSSRRESRKTCSTAGNASCHGSPPG